MPGPERTSRTSKNIVFGAGIAAGVAAGVVVSREIRRRFQEKRDKREERELLGQLRDYFVRREAERHGPPRPLVEDQIEPSGVVGGFGEANGPEVSEVLPEKPQILPNMRLVLSRGINGEPPNITGELIKFLEEHGKYDTESANDRKIAWGRAGEVVE